ncbi:MAG TPA: hypothetical protein EYH40_00775 [Desulfurococcales archaeon]|nr:hypothetical protein [Desulfurococcales archaeon]
MRAIIVEVEIAVSVVLLVIALILIYKSKLHSTRLNVNKLIESLSGYITSWRKHSLFDGIVAEVAKAKNTYLVIPKLNSIPWTMRVVKFYNKVKSRSKRESVKESSILIIKSKGLDAEVYNISSAYSKLEYPKSLEKLKNISLYLTERYLLLVDSYKNYVIPSPKGKGFLHGSALVVSFSSEEIPSLDLIPKILDLLLDFAEKLK